MEVVRNSIGDNSQSLCNKISMNWLQHTGLVLCYRMRVLRVWLMMDYGMVKGILIALSTEESLYH